jgi:hypothetical protein
MTATVPAHIRSASVFCGTVTGRVSEHFYLVGSTPLNQLFCPYAGYVTAIVDSDPEVTDIFCPVCDD